MCFTDNLFGSCISLDSSHLPYYNLDPRGLREVKSSIKFLIDENLEWKDEISQVLEMKELVRVKYHISDREPILERGHVDIK